MTVTLRERAEHAAKYGANLVVPAREIKQLLDERDAAITAGAAVLDGHSCDEQAERSHRRTAELEAALDRVRALHLPAGAPPVCQHCQGSQGTHPAHPCPTIRALTKEMVL